MKLAHYYLAVNALTKPMQVREDSLPYRGRLVTRDDWVRHSERAKRRVMIETMSRIRKA